jgi:hypothetical protein
VACRGSAAARAAEVGVWSRLAVSWPAGQEIRICMARFNNMLNSLARGDLAPSCQGPEWRKRKDPPEGTSQSRYDIMLVNVNAFTSVSWFIPVKHGLDRQTAAVTTAT